MRRRVIREGCLPPTSLPTNPSPCDLPPYVQVTTAEHVYAECDGASFENSAMTLDLRFIPEEMEFAEARVRDRATELPPK